MDEHRSEGRAEDLLGVSTGPGRELSCREFVELLDEHLDGALSSEREAVFERHLGTCADCRNYLDSYRETIRISAAALRARPEPQGIPEELIRSILRGRKS